MSKLDLFGGFMYQEEREEGEEHPGGLTLIQLRVAYCSNPIYGSFCTC